MKKILVIGNLGYVGSALNKYLFEKKIKVTGIDPNWFGSKKFIRNQKKFTTNQYLEDIRDVYKNKKIWNTTYDAVIYLAAVSNDPMGKNFEKMTHEINANYCLKVARIAKNKKIKKFIFASSCSMYGIANDKLPSENTKLKPLTAYAKSKVWAEKNLKKLADNTFSVYCLRFATACGSSPNIRLDLVLNDLVTSAIINRKIEVLSDGSPWRPLVHVQDMCRAIHWAIESKKLPYFFPVNIGSEKFTFQIKELAQVVSAKLKNTPVTIASDKAVDSRSYKVNFNLFYKMAPKSFLPKYDIYKTIADLKDFVKKNKINKQFRNSYNWIRLKKLNHNIKTKKMNINLKWKK